PPPPPKVNELHSFSHIIGEENSFKKVIKNCKHVAPSDAPVLIYGETGTGKELFAQAIHNESPRHLKPFVPVNCSAIPEQLLEGVLFGTTKGAFTSSVDKRGLLESAHGGSIFLDEMNSMPLSLQPKLLRFLQENKIRRVGGEDEIPVDVRVISAFNIHPMEAVAQNLIRQDIYYRLAVFFVDIPPLRRRKLDIPALCHHFLFKWGKTDIHISDDIFNRFFQYDWPGNVRELENIVEGAVALLDEGDRVLALKDLPEYFDKHQRTPVAAPAEKELSPILAQGLDYLKQIVENQGQMMGRSRKDRACLPGTSGDIKPEELSLVRDLFLFFKTQRENNKSRDLKSTLEFVEIQLIQRALKKSEGNITRAAQKLGLTQQNLSYKLKKAQIPPIKSIFSLSKQ
ncbi:MAG: sigma 54-interacting transcriptional regulator, partial [Desulfovibrionales bacterium]|nr:sigma 54-interacting transcriptional regulator [Desulfovibrionales bacterium]